MKTAKKESLEILRSPYKLLLFTAFVLPALNTLILGGGMTLCAYYGLFSDAVRLIYEILSVVYGAVRYTLVIFNVMLLGFVAMKNKFEKAFLPLFTAVLYGAATAIVSIAVYVLSLLLGLTDSTLKNGLWAELKPYLPTLLWDLLILLGIYFVSTLVFAAVGAVKGRKQLLSGFSPFFITTLCIIGVYTAVLLANQVFVVMANEESGRIFVRFVLPFLYQLIYGGAMVAGAYLFIPVLRKYFYKKKQKAQNDVKIHDGIADKNAK